MISPKWAKRVKHATWFSPFGWMIEYVVCLPSVHWHQASASRPKPLCPCFLPLPPIHWHCPTVLPLMHFRPSFPPLPSFGKSSSSFYLHSWKYDIPNASTVGSGAMLYNLKILIIFSFRLHPIESRSFIHLVWQYSATHRVPVRVHHVHCTWFKVQNWWQVVCCITK